MALWKQQGSAIGVELSFSVNTHRPLVKTELGSPVGGLHHLFFIRCWSICNDYTLWCFLLDEKYTRISRTISQFSLLTKLILVLVDVADPLTRHYPPSRCPLCDIHPGTSIMYTHALCHLDPRAPHLLNSYVPSTPSTGSHGSLWTSFMSSENCGKMEEGNISDPLFY